MPCHAASGSGTGVCFVMQAKDAKKDAKTWIGDWKDKSKNA